MRITWRDAVTTVSAATAIVIERAYFHDWDWPLVSDISWVIFGLCILGLITILVGFSYDQYAAKMWTYIAATWSAATIAVTGLGMAYEVSDYVVILMLNAVAAWAVSLAFHFMEHTTTPRVHMPR